MVDSINQRVADNNNPSLPDDDVSGYTMRQIEDILINQKTWDGLKEGLRNSYNNPTESQLDKLFNHYN